MGRLIDTDVLLARISLNYNNHQNITAGAMKDIINTTPTAYNVEKVVAEMERIKNDASQGCDEVSHDKCNTYKNCADCIFDRTICIVKAGGVDG